MNKFTLRQLLVPFITTAIIIFIWFGPIPRNPLENILISILIIFANYLEFGGKPFYRLGFRRENFTLKNIFVLAPLVGLALFVFYVFVAVPGITKLTGVPINYSSFDRLEGNLQGCLIALIVVWATAAFGEEIIFRGYFMRQLVKFIGESMVSIPINIVLLSSFFGFMHGYQGITGQLVAGAIGALLATIFYLRKYDLWFVIAVHGFFDTFALACIYLGMT